MADRAEFDPRRPWAVWHKRPGGSRWVRRGRFASIPEAWASVAARVVKGGAWGVDGTGRDPNDNGDTAVLWTRTFPYWVLWYKRPNGRKWVRCGTYGDIIDADAAQRQKEEAARYHDCDWCICKTGTHPDDDGEEKPNGSCRSPG